MRKIMTWAVSLCAFTSIHPCQATAQPYAHERSPSIAAVNLEASVSSAGPWSGQIGFQRDGEHSDLLGDGSGRGFFPRGATSLRIETETTRDSLGAASSDSMMAAPHHDPETVPLGTRSFMERHPVVFHTLMISVALLGDAMVSSGAYADDEGRTLAAIDVGFGLLGLTGCDDCSTAEGYGALTGSLALAATVLVVGANGASADQLFTVNMIGFPLAIVLGTAIGGLFND